MNQNRVKNNDEHKITNSTLNSQSEAWSMKSASTRIVPNCVFGSVANVPGSDSPQTPDRITLQLRYLKDGVDPTSEERKLPESTGGVLPFSNYIVIT